MNKAEVEIAAAALQSIAGFDKTRMSLTVTEGIFRALADELGTDDENAMAERLGIGAVRMV